MVLTPLCTILHESKVVLVFAQWLFIFWQTDIRQRSHYFFWLLAPPNSPHFSLFSYFNTQIMKSWRDLSTLFFIHFHYVLLCTYFFLRCLRWDWRAEFLLKLTHNQKNKSIFTKFDSIIFPPRTKTGRICLGHEYGRQHYSIGC